MSEVVVIKLARKSLWVYKVGPEGLGEFSETEWKPDNLDQLLRTIKVKFQTTKARVILADEISYNLEFDWPDKDKPTRTQIQAELEGRVPDEIKENNWDYDLVETEGGKFKVRVFVPVEDVFETFMKTCKQVGLGVEVVVPESFLGEGDDLMIKAARLKLNKKDEELLGIVSEKKEESILNKPISFGGESSKDKEVDKEIEEEEKSNKLIIWGGLVLVVILSGVLVWLLQNKRNRPAKVYGSPRPSPSSTPVAVVKEKPKEASSAGVKKEEVDLSKYKIKVENGSGIAGEAGRVREILADEGFEQIKTGNADKFDYQETIVEVKPGVAEKVSKTIERALNDRYVMKFQGLKKDSEYDVLIIVGKLFVQEEGGETGK